MTKQYSCDCGQLVNSRGKSTHEVGSRHQCYLEEKAMRDAGLMKFGYGMHTTNALEKLGLPFKTSRIYHAGGPGKAVTFTTQVWVTKEIGAAAIHNGLTTKYPEDFVLLHGPKDPQYTMADMILFTHQHIADFLKQLNETIGPLVALQSLDDAGFWK